MVPEPTPVALGACADDGGVGGGGGEGCARAGATTTALAAGAKRRKRRLCTTGLCHAAAAAAASARDATARACEVLPVEPDLLADAAVLLHLEEALAHRAALPAGVVPGAATGCRGERERPRGRERAGRAVLETEAGAAGRTHLRKEKRVMSQPGQRGALRSLSNSSGSKSSCVDFTHGRWQARFSREWASGRWRGSPLARCRLRIVQDPPRLWLWEGPGRASSASVVSRRGLRAPENRAWACARARGRVQRA